MQEKVLCLSQMVKNTNNLFSVYMPKREVAFFGEPVFSTNQSFYVALVGWIKVGPPKKHFFDTQTACSFICQGISTRRQRRNIFGLRVKLLLLLPV